MSLIVLIVFGFILMIVISTGSFSCGGQSSEAIESTTGLLKFGSEEELVQAFRGYLYPNVSLYGGISGRLTNTWSSTGLPNSYVAVVDANSPAATFGTAYSTTNVQVDGVDEADIIKTDGNYIYLVSKNKLVIVKAYPATDAQIVFETTYENFTPQELFIRGDRLLVIGSSCLPSTLQTGYHVSEYVVVLPSSGVTSARLYDLADRSAPQLINTVDIEGYYDTSRMIDDYAYLVVNTYGHTYWRDNLTASELVPLYREGSDSYGPIAKATDIYYLPPVDSNSFVTICSIGMDTGKIEKETILGSGCQVYASLDNLFLTRPTYADMGQNTTIVKLHLDQGQVQNAGTGKVPGYLLNQFSMDEHDGYLRIATTRGNPVENNLYILDGDMNTVGALEGLAPGESIYSTRFMGSRCYVVTFKKTDPLFVIDLSDPRSPGVLGQLKIPGYSSYLHPYDETHLIGIGMDSINSGDTGSGILSSMQGVKMALFDVSDAEHPRELYKVIIGDRGSGSAVLYDHRAFLFDRDKELIVLPVSVSMVSERDASNSQYCEYLWEGAYIYDVNLTHGFVLRGSVTHFDSAEEIQNYSYRTANGDRSIQRSLYIGDVLYTMSRTRLQLNDLATLEKVKAIEINTLSTTAMYDPNVSGENGFYQFPAINTSSKQGS